MNAPDEEPFALAPEDVGERLLAGAGDRSGEGESLQVPQHLPAERHAQAAPVDREGVGASLPQVGERYTDPYRNAYKKLDPEAQSYFERTLKLMNDQGATPLPVFRPINPKLRYALLLGLLLWASLPTLSKPSPFLYFQF
jgi:hypothetical protein